MESLLQIRATAVRCGREQRRTSKPWLGGPEWNLYDVETAIWCHCYVQLVKGCLEHWNIGENQCTIDLYVACVIYVHCCCKAAARRSVRTYVLVDLN
jgi:hypothetical protein